MGKILLIVISVKISQNQSFMFLVYVNIIIINIPIRDELLKIIHDRHDIDFSISNFDKIFYL